MIVQELMTVEPLTCAEDESLERAAQLMWDADIGLICVVDSAGMLRGVISDRDALMAAYTQGKCLSEIKIGSVMARAVRGCAPGDNVTLAEEMMRRHQLRRLPVVSLGRLVGMLSLSDIALAAGNQVPSESGPVKLESVAITLARVCEPRRARRRVEALAAE